MIRLDNISKQHGHQILFIDASMGLQKGEKVGLVGPNGAGKTTIFRMIAGREQPDDGQVTIDPGMAIGYFSQDVGEMSGQSAVAAVMDGVGPVSALATEIAELEAAMADPDQADNMDALVERYGEVQGRFEELDGYALDARAREVLAGLSSSQERMEGDVGIRTDQRSGSLPMGEEIRLTASDGGSFAAYLALPARLPAPALVVLPEIFNANPHIRSVADGWAADGFIAVAPDVFWRQEAGCFLPYTDEGRTKARALQALLDTDQYARDLADVVVALRARPDCTGKVGVMGFCLGGKFAWLASTRLPVEAAVSYYGVAIDQHLDEADRRRCPLLMHFASDDPHVPEATVAAIRARLEGQPGVDIHVYPGTEHGFNRKGYPMFNEAAAATARQRTLALLRTALA